jgi:quercetin dioxygenase-like cupin family protein
VTIRFLVEGEQSGGALALIEFDVPASARIAAPHSHDGYEETIYGLEGVLTWTVEGEATDVGPGEVLVIPRGAVHHFDNDGDVDAKALAVVTPGVLGPGFFREVAAVLDAAAGGPPDRAASPRSCAATASRRRPRDRPRRADRPERDARDHDPRRARRRDDHRYDVRAGAGRRRPSRG